MHTVLLILNTKHDFQFVKVVGSARNNSKRISKSATSFLACFDVVAARVLSVALSEDNVHIRKAATCKGNNPHLSLLTRLVELHPRGPSMADRQGKLPLHLACDLGKEWDAIKAIYDAFPDALEKAEENARGWLPLHVVAACANASSDLLRKLVELYSEAASVSDRNGRFPLHLACLSAKSWKGGLECLFDANPAAVDTRDKCGLLPLHVAALRMCTLSSDNATDTSLAATTSKHAKNEVADLDILFELLRADPTTLTN